MNALKSWTIDYLLNSLWQVPLIFAAAWLAARLARPTGPRTEHRIWVCALMLETILPMCSAHPDTLWRQAWELVAWMWGGSVTGGNVRVILGPGIVSGTGFLRLPAALLAAIGIAYACTLLYFAGRLAWGLWRTNQLLLQSQPMSMSLPMSIYLEAKLNRHVGLPGPVQIAISPMIYGPVTVGIRRRILLLPPGFLETVDETDLEAVLAHECAHMRRRDFAKNLIYGILSLPAAYHPVLWLTNAQISETREMVCDEMAAAASVGRESYARALLRLASMLSHRTPARTLHAIGIFDANIFERRVMNLTQKPPEIRTARRLAIVTACAVVALAACTSALALRINVFEAQNARPQKIAVKADYLKLTTRVDPIYPENGVNGSVALTVLISKEGAPEHISIESGPREDQNSAMEAVRQWRWQPYLLNGEPIEVETTVTVVFSKEK
jgi:TonB family protein